VSSRLLRVLVVNAGSSSLKLSLLDHDDAIIGSANLPATGGVWDDSALADALVDWPVPDAVGHRVVHGGREFTAPVQIDDHVLARLTGLTDLAPLHQPKSLAGIDMIRRILPGIPAVACFDTAFHATLPEAASTYAIPATWRDAYGLRRYGFHGLSHSYAARRATELTGGHRIVVAHLGAGASLCAVRDGRSIDTTMGFTPLEGLVMATRSGSLDPGLLLWLNTHAKVPIAEIGDTLEHRSGLLALAGTADMAEILTRTDPPARLAVEVYIHRLCREIAAMTASLGGLDALVFTGGVGEHAPQIRARTVAGLAYLGLQIAPDRNEDVDGDAVIDTAGSAGGDRAGIPGMRHVLVVTAREDLEIAGGTRHVIGER
jgi:acetate kinase